MEAGGAEAPAEAMVSRLYTAAAVVTATNRTEEDDKKAEDTKVEDTRAEYTKADQAASVTLKTSFPYYRQRFLPFVISFVVYSWP